MRASDFRVYRYRLYRWLEPGDLEILTEKERDPIRPKQVAETIKQIVEYITDHKNFGGTFELRSFTLYDSLRKKLYTEQELQALME